MFSYRIMILLLCLLSLLLVAGCRSSAPKKVKGPNGVTLQRGELSKQQIDDYGKVRLEQMRRQGKTFPAKPK